MTLVMNPANSPEAIAALLDRCTGDKVPSEEQWRSILLANAHLTYEGLAKLSLDSSDFVRLLLAMHEDCPEGVRGSLMNDLASSPHELVRTTLADLIRIRSVVRAETLQNLATDAVSTIRTRVAGSNKTPPFTLENLASDTEPSVRAEVASNTSTPTQTLEALATDPSEVVRLNVAINVHCPPQLRPSIYRRLADGESIWTRIRVAEAEDCPPDVLEMLSNDRETTAYDWSWNGVESSAFGPRHAVGTNPQCPTSVLAKMAKSTETCLRALAAVNTRTDTQLLHRLASDKSPEVRSAALRNPSFEVVSFEDLLAPTSGPVEDDHKDAEQAASIPLMFNAASHPSCPAPMLVKLSRQESYRTHEWTLEKWTFGHESLATRVAANPSTPSSVLDELADHFDIAVRMLVLDHPNCSVDAIAKLSTDESMHVRELAAVVLRRSAT